MKAHAKLAIFAVASVAVSPLVALARLERSVGGGESLFQGASQALALAPFRVGVYLRAAFHAHACSAVDREVAIGFLTLLSHADTDLGRNVYIGAQSNIGSCSIGRDCLLGSGVHVLSGKRQHDFSDPDRLIREQGGAYAKISIGENCWIGNQATVMANVGAHSIVAAGAVVVDDVPCRSIVGGNPAKVLRTR